MGLSNFPSASEGVLPVLVLNTVLSVALLKNMVRSLLQVMGSTFAASSNLDIEDETDDTRRINAAAAARERRISISRFKCTRHHSSAAGTSATECCVCLCGFEGDEEVSELSCKHFFHRGCLDKWFNNHHTTCPLCRSIQ